MRTCIFASEVAALAGLHPYKSCEQAVVAICRREGVDAADRADEQTVLAVATAQRAEETAKHLDAEVTRKRKAAPNQQHAAAEREAVAAKQHATDAQVAVLATERVATEARKVQEMHEAVEVVLNDPVVRQSMEKAVSSSATAGEAIERFELPTATTPAIVRELHSRVACRIGQVQEASALAQYADTHGQQSMDIKQKGHRKKYTTDIGNRFVLFGRLDGMQTDGIAVETKTRRNRLFGRVPEYEKIQLTAYMILTNATKGVLVENYNGEQETHDVPLDLSFWENNVIPKLFRGVDIVEDRLGRSFC